MADAKVATIRKCPGTESHLRGLLDPFGDNSGLAAYNFNGNATDLGGNYNGTEGSDIDYVIGKHGKAITLVTTEEFREIQRIQKELGANMRLETIQIDNRDKNSNFISLEQKVRSVEIDELAIDFIDSMDDMDYHEFVERVVTILLKESSHATTQIGYDLDTVNNMINEYQDEQKVAQKSNRQRKRR